MDFEKRHEIGLDTVLGQGRKPKDAPEEAQRASRPRRRPPILDEDGVPDPELRGCDYVRPARGFDGRPVDLG